ncbi:MAG: pyrroloquinoline quinone precursor peptide PqqA [Rhodospirillaceae bacterium]|nr:pyrroloquinoline quinone precursor peptide PqqA [Rhodospirillaceae bacterium]
MCVVFGLCCNIVEQEETVMKKWSKPKAVEICVGMEINAYYPAEF